MKNTKINKDLIKDPTIPFAQEIRDEGEIVDENDPVDNYSMNTIIDNSDDSEEASKLLEESDKKYEVSKVVHGEDLIPIGEYSGLTETAIPAQTEEPTHLTTKEHTEAHGNKIKSYNKLSNCQIELVNRVKELEEYIASVIENIDKIADAESPETSLDPRDRAIARTHYEDAGMRLIRAIAKPKCPFK